MPGCCFFWSGLLEKSRSVDRCNLRFVVAEAADDFEDFAPRREHPATLAFVVVHRPHELDLFTRVVAFAGRRVDQAAAFHLAARSCSPFFALVIDFAPGDSPFGLAASVAADALILESSFHRFDRVRAAGHAFHLLSQKRGSCDPSRRLGIVPW